MSFDCSAFREGVTMNIGDKVKVTFIANVVNVGERWVTVDLEGHDMSDHFFYFDSTMDNVQIEPYERSQPDGD